MASTTPWMPWTSISASADWTNPCFIWFDSAPRRSTGAYCLDIHWKDLRAVGEGDQRLYSLHAWRECPYYTDRERAALAWTEAVTLVTDGHVPDTVYEQVRPHFSERELSDITLAVATINAWNRLSIAARLVPGNYQAATKVS